jgi:hypothetical protein
MPAPSPIPADAIAVVLGGDHGCYALASGVVKCSGLADRGQLGDGTNTSRATFADVKSTLGGIVGLEASRCTGCTSGSELSGRTTCALFPGGTVQCWGQNIYNMLGDGSGSAKNVPVATTVVSGVKQLAIGGLASCALDGTGKVTCWGGTSYLGNSGGTIGVSGVFTTLNSGAEEISATSLFTCASMAGAGVKCWGKGATPGGLSPIGIVDVAGM